MAFVVIYTFLFLRCGRSLFESCFFCSVVCIIIIDLCLALACFFLYLLFCCLSDSRLKIFISTCRCTAIANTKPEYADTRSCETALSLIVFPVFLFITCFISFSLHPPFSFLSLPCSFSLALSFSSSLT